MNKNLGIQVYLRVRPTKKSYHGFCKHYHKRYFVNNHKIEIEPEAKEVGFTFPRDG